MQFSRPSLRGDLKQFCGSNLARENLRPFCGSRSALIRLILLQDGISFAYNRSTNNISFHRYSPMHNPVSLCNGRIVHRRLVFFAWSITTGQLEKPGDRSEYTVAWNLVLGTRQHPFCAVRLPRQEQANIYTNSSSYSCRPRLLAEAHRHEACEVLAF